MQDVEIRMSHFVRLIKLFCHHRGSNALFPSPNLKPRSSFPPALPHLVMESPEEKMRRDDDNASKIAEKLLQGWTMLAEYCPVEGCTTPLMRSRDQKVFCVAHEMFVMSSEEADAMKRSGVGVDGATSATMAPTVSTKDETFVEPDPISVDSLDEDFYKKLKSGAKVSFSETIDLDAETPRFNSAASSFAHTPRFKSPTSSFEKKADGSVNAMDDRVVDSEVAAISQATAKTLSEKLEQARLMLHSTSVADGEEFLRVLEVVERLAGAIKACNGL